MRSTGGTSYGIAGTPAQMGLGRPGPRTRIDGPFLVGASTRSVHGVTHAMLGGVEAASAILGMPTQNVLGSARSTRTTAATPPTAGESGELEHPLPHGRAEGYGRPQRDRPTRVAAQAPAVQRGPP